MTPTTSLAPGAPWPWANPAPSEPEAPSTLIQRQAKARQAYTEEARFLLKHGDWTAGALGKALRISKATAYRLAVRLVEEGVVYALEEPRSPLQVGSMNRAVTYSWVKPPNPERTQ